MQGWVIVEKDTLKCGLCGLTWGVGGLDEIRDEVIRKEVERRLGESAIERHRKGCAWRNDQCPGMSVHYRLLRVG